MTEYIAEEIEVIKQNSSIAMREGHSYLARTLTNAANFAAACQNQQLQAELINLCQIAVLKLSKSRR